MVLLVYLQGAHEPTYTCTEATAKKKDRTTTNNKYTISNRNRSTFTSTNMLTITFVLWSFRMSYCVIYFVCLFRFFFPLLSSWSHQIERCLVVGNREYQRETQRARECERYRERRSKWPMAVPMQTWHRIKAKPGTINGKLKLKRSSRTT